MDISDDFYHHHIGTNSNNSIQVILKEADYGRHETGGVLGRGKHTEVGSDPSDCNGNNGRTFSFKEKVTGQIKPRETGAFCYISIGVRPVGVSFKISPPCSRIRSVKRMPFR